MRYRLHIRTATGHDKKVEVECDEVEFENAWWARFYAAPFTDGRKRTLLFAVPSEHLTMMELVESAG